MQYLIIKYLITAGVVVLVSEFAKRSDKLGGLIAALPMVTVLTLIWLYVEHQPTSKIANHAYYTFWYVLPTRLCSLSLFYKNCENVKHRIILHIHMIPHPTKITSQL